ncbi:hypothetical protein B0H14DRAFT_2584938 [Mycena olivaceomarginata]|nr:hypothetical protein B0H14DRAFT_2584938 [Mycena olivaceomarginata]
MYIVELIYHVGEPGELVRGRTESKFLCRAIITTLPGSEPQSRAPFGLWGINPRSARQSCAQFWVLGEYSRDLNVVARSVGFWGIRLRSARQSFAPFGFWGNKAAICVSVARSGWVPGD